MGKRKSDKDKKSVPLVVRLNTGATKATRQPCRHMKAVGRAMAALCVLA